MKLGKPTSPKKEIEQKPVKRGPKLAADIAKITGKNRAKQLRNRNGSS